jgi:uncharacterized integral membrane protein
MKDESSTPGGISPRVWIGGGIALLVGLFIVLNRDETQINFIFFQAQAALWMALTLAAMGGFAAGYLFSRKRHKA